MQAITSELEDLRKEIDRVDRAMLDLLIRRTEVVRRVAEVKGDRERDRLAVRPAREAQVLRRLVEDNAGRFPPAALVRMWRELIAVLTRIQTPLAVAVYAPREGAPTWDLARDHFGSSTPIQRVDSASQAIRAAGNGSATLAVLPLPGDDDRWWPTLMSDHYDRLRVFARLPFVRPLIRDGESSEAIAIGRIELETSGDDQSLLALEAEVGVSRARLRSLLADAGLDPVWLAAARPPGEPGALHLVEVPSLVQDGDPRIGAVLAAARREVLRIVSLGGYPRPITVAGPA